MSDTVPPVIPWYQSPVLVGLLTTALTSFLALAPGYATKLGLTSKDAVPAVVEYIMQGLAFLALLFTMFKRVKSDVQPLTLTAAGAAVHPLTIAANLAAQGVHDDSQTASVPVPASPVSRPPFL
jgi:hypothetical protein